MYLVDGAIISGDAGHNCIPDMGLIGIRKEDDCTKEVWTNIVEKLVRLGYKIYDCTPWGEDFQSIGNSQLFRVKKANNSLSSLHLSIHFNSGGGRGVECWISEGDDRAEKFATEICRSISKLGYYNRGVKIGNLYIPKYTNMPCVLIECCYIDSTEDMNLYDPDILSEAIVKAIINLGTT